MTPTAIRKLRKALRLTQAQFANLLGVHAITISRWEGGRAEPVPYNVQQLVALDEGIEHMDKTRFQRLIDMGRFVEALAVAILGGLNARTTGGKRMPT